MGWGIIVFVILELIGIALVSTFVWAYEKAKRAGTEVEKWAWALLAVGVLLMLGAIAFLFVGRSKPKVHPPMRVVTVQPSSVRPSSVQPAQSPPLQLSPIRSPPTLYQRPVNPFANPM